jgi:hypothetical protein
VEPIEFIVEPPPDEPGELLPAPRRPRGLVLAGLALVVAIGIGWALVHHSSSSPAAAPTVAPTATPTVTPTAAASASLPAIGGLHPISAPATVLPTRVGTSLVPGCRTPGCTASATVPKDVTAALARYVVGAGETTVSTIVREDVTSGNPELVRRLIDSHIGSVDLLIRITPYQHPEPTPTVGISPTPPGLGSAFFRTVTAAYVIDIQWTGTDSTPPPVDALQSLADDPGLETLG